MGKILFIDEWSSAIPLSISGHGLGSSIFKLAAIVDAVEQGFLCHLLTSEAKKELLIDTSVDYFYTSEDEIDFNSFDHIIFMGILQTAIQKEFSVLWTGFSEEDVRCYKRNPHIRFWREYVAGILNYKVPATPAELTLSVDHLARLPNEFQEAVNQTWIAVSLGAVSPLKTYKDWESVISSLLLRNEKLSIVLLGAQSLPFSEHRRVLNLTGQTGIGELKKIISKSSLVIGSDGLITNIAMALSIPTVNLFTVISPQSVIDPHQANRSPVTAMVKEGCPYQFCYADIDNYRSSGCLYNQKRGLGENEIPCLQFSAEEIVEQAISLLENPGKSTEL